MVVSCERVWQEISNYLENDVDPALRSALENHVHHCKDCTAVLEGTRNVIQLYGDNRLFPIPMGYSWRLRRRLANNMPARRGTAFGWAVAVAALALIAGTAVLTNSKNQSQPVLRSEHAQPGHGIPSSLVVLVTQHGKLFHIAGCPFMRQDDHPHQMTAKEALDEGYIPCVRCLGEYVTNWAAIWLKKAVLA